MFFGTTSIVISGTNSNLQLHYIALPVSKRLNKIISLLKHVCYFKVKIHITDIYSTSLPIPFFELKWQNQFF